MSCLSVEFEKFNFQVGTAKIDKNRYSAGKSWNLQNLRGSVNSAISAASAESRIPMGTDTVWCSNQCSVLCFAVVRPCIICILVHVVMRTPAQPCATCSATIQKCQCGCELYLLWVVRKRCQTSCTTIMYNHVDLLLVYHRIVRSSHCSSVTPVHSPLRWWISTHYTINKPFGPSAGHVFITKRRRSLLDHGGSSGLYCLSVCLSVYLSVCHVVRSAP